ncbi:MAG: amidohydrolase family protein [Armatimonadota bacterium]
MNIVDINTCFGTSPTRRVQYAEVVTAARHFDDPANARPTFQDIDWSLEHLQAVLKRHAVDYALTYSMRGKLYDFVAGNSETHQVTQTDERLVPAATIDPRRHFDCLEEVERCLEMGMKVFRFFPEQQGWTPDGLPFLRLCEELAPHDAAVMLPAGSWGNQSTIARRLADMDINVIIAGATFAAIAESMSLADYANIFWETSAMHPVQAIESMVSEAGAERLLFGSNSPEWSFEAASNLLQVADITESDRAAIIGGNAIELLDLEAAD